MHMLYGERWRIATRRRRVSPVLLIGLKGFIISRKSIISLVLAQALLPNLRLNSSSKNFQWDLQKNAEGYSSLPCFKHHTIYYLRAPVFAAYPKFGRCNPWVRWVDFDYCQCIGMSPKSVFIIWKSWEIETSLYMAGHPLDVCDYDRRTTAADERYTRLHQFK